MATPSLKLPKRIFRRESSPKTLAEQMTWRQSKRRSHRTTIIKFRSRIDIPKALWNIMFFFTAANQIISALESLTAVIEFFSQRGC